MADAVWRALVDGGWSGDLKDVTIKEWAEDIEVAALYAVQDAQLYVWINLRHADSPALSWQAWLWCRYHGAYHPPFDVLPATKLAELRALDAQGAQEA